MRARLRGRRAGLLGLAVRAAGATSCSTGSPSARAATCSSCVAASDLFLRRPRLVRCATRVGPHADGGPPPPRRRATSKTSKGTESCPSSVTDDRGRTLDFHAPPRRVVSLVPSDTLNVAALGCEGALVGRTDYCELPADVVAKLPSVGGTKNPRVDAICELSPDLVLANQEENTRGDLEELARRGVRVYVAFPKRVADGLAHMARLARIFRVEGDARVRPGAAGYAALREAEKARATLVSRCARSAPSGWTR